MKTKTHYCGFLLDLYETRKHKNEAPSSKTHERSFVLRNMTDKRYNLSYAYRFDKKMDSNNLTFCFTKKKTVGKSHLLVLFEEALFLNAFETNVVSFVSQS